MKEQIIYIADDGTPFDSKQDCLVYEKEGSEELKKKNKLKEIYSERRHQKNVKKNALCWIQYFKSKANTKDWQVEPTVGNAINLQMNLARIEAIYINAKKQFFKDLNTPDLDLKTRVERIHHSANVLEIAIKKRNEILTQFKTCQKDIINANKRLAELDKEEAELKNSEKE